MAMMMVTRNETSTTVDRSDVNDMSDPSDAGELAPRHADVGGFFDGGEDLGNVDHGDEQETVGDGEGYERQVFFFGDDGVERSGNIEHRQQHPPVENSRCHSRRERGNREHQPAEDVDGGPEHGLE